MSGKAIEIYLKTIATGDGLKKVAQDYAGLVKAAKEASAEMTRTAKEAAREQERAAKEAAAAVKKAEAEKASDAQKAAREASAAARKAAQEQEREVKRLADAESKAASGKARSLLELSRIAQDAQYGLGGVVNNVEGLALALGLGTGLTGVIAGLAAGIQLAGPAILEWFEKLDTAGASLKDNVATLERASVAIGGGYSSNAENAEEIERKRQETLRREKEHFEDLNKALERRLELANAIREAEAAAEQRAAASKSADLAAQNLPEAQAAMEADRAKREQLTSQYGREKQADMDIWVKETKALYALDAQYKAAEEKAARLDEERNISRREKFLTKEQGELETKLQDARRQFAEWNDPERGGSSKVVMDELSAAIAKLEAELAANRNAQRDNARSAPGGHVRDYDQVSGQYNKAVAEEDRLRRAFQQAVQEEAHRQQMASVAAGTRDDTYRRDIEGLDRAMQLRFQEMIKNLPTGLPGMNPAYSLPRPGEPAGNGVMDPRNFREPWGGLPQVPGAPPPPQLPPVPQVDTKPVEAAAQQAADETAKGLAGITAAFQQMAALWENAQKQIATLQAQGRNSNRMA